MNICREGEIKVLRRRGRWEGADDNSCWVRAISFPAFGGEKLVIPEKCEIEYFVVLCRGFRCGIVWCWDCCDKFVDGLGLDCDGLGFAEDLFTENFFCDVRNLSFSRLSNLYTVKFSSQRKLTERNYWKLKLFHEKYSTIIMIDCKTPQFWEYSPNTPCLNCFYAIDIHPRTHYNYNVN